MSNTRTRIWNGFLPAWLQRGVAAVLLLGPWVAPTWAQPNDATNQPDQAHAMMDVGYHFANLWFAAQNTNWPLAKYYLDTTGAHLKWAVQIRPFRPTKSGEPVDLNGILQAVTNTFLTAVDQAITQKDPASFRAAYSQTLVGCYACHRAAEKPFLRLRIPDAPGASIIDLAPEEKVVAANGATDDVSLGKAFFQANCALCHATGSSPGGVITGGQGPSLAGVVGRRAGTGANFNYTKALADSGQVWSDATLDRFLNNPLTTVPGTTMLVLVPEQENRTHLIAYLKTLAAPAPGTATTAPVVKLAPEADPASWLHVAPGMAHHVDVAALPAPFATTSGNNGPRVVRAPAEAKLSVPDGFTLQKFATGLNGPRLLRVAPNGDIFIAETGARRIRVMRAADGAEAPTENQVFAEGLDRPFGIAFYPPTGEPQWLYAANNNSVVRFPYHSGDLKATGPAEVIVPHLANTTGGHTTRDVAFSKDGKRMFISIGSGSNIGEEVTQKKSAEEARAWEAEHGFGTDWGAESNRAVVCVTDPEGHDGLHTYASGIRNAVGLAVNQITGDLWVSVNERDNLGDDLVPDYISRIKEGGYYGWPWYYMGNHEDPRHAGERPDLAGKAIVPDVPVQAHSASLEMTFYTATSGAALFPAEYRGDAFAAFHGSWNRNNRTGYKVVRIRCHDGIPTGEYDDFLTGYVVDNTSVWGRPVGVTVAHDGALLITEDGNGTMLRVAYTGK